MAIKPGLKFLFSNVECLSSTRALNALSTGQQAAPVEVPRMLWMYCAGIVCQDINSLNPRCSENRDSCAQGSGRTGGTWRACIGYLNSHRPRHALFENVATLRTKSPADSGKGDLDRFVARSGR